MDNNNPIIKLVNEGLWMEKSDNNVAAQKLYIQAWDKASDSWEKCVAAHFVARHQKSAEDTLKWNMESLNQADKAKNESVKTYYPSLYLAMGYSYEKLDNYVGAKKYYDLAFAKISDLPTDIENEKYSEGLRETIIESREKLKEKMK